MTRYHCDLEEWLYLLGTPDTRRNGRSTRNALSAFTSNPAPFPPRAFAPSALVACSKIALKSLEERKGKWNCQTLNSLKAAWESKVCKHPQPGNQRPRCVHGTDCAHHKMTSPQCGYCPAKGHHLCPTEV